MTKIFFALISRLAGISNFFTALILLAGLLFGCDDEPYQIGIDLLPDEDYVEVNDTSLSVETYIIGPVGIPVYDSLNFPFGNYCDPVFGQTKAGMMLEFSPASNYTRIHEGVIVDSVVMYIYYDTVYGEQSYLPQIEVFELTDGIDKSTRYYTDFDKNGKYDPSNLSVSLTEKPDTTDKLRLMLDNSLGDYLLGIPAMNDSDIYISYKMDSIFDISFRGLYLNPFAEGGDRSLMNIRAVTFIVRFHTDVDTTSISFAFIPDDDRYLSVNGQRVPIGDKFIKVFEQDYAGSMITHLNDSNFHDTVIYLQSLGGTQAVLEITSLAQLRQETGSVSVNHAELIIPALSDSAGLVDGFYPQQLGVRIMDEADPFLPDDVLYQTSQYTPAVSYMNGSFNSSDWGYRFNMTAYFHEYLKGNINSSRILIFAGRLDAYLGRTNFNPVRYNSLLLAGSSNINKKITLKVAYTKL